MAKKQQEPEFTISDRRKFTSEGERREGATETVDASEATTAELETPSAATPPSSPSAAKPEIPASGRMEFQSTPPVPSAEEQKTQQEAYHASNTKLDEMLSASAKAQGRAAAEFEMTFERLVASLYMSALMQLGLMTPEGEKPRADIMAARQTIDSLSLLRDKTKGNLTDAEQRLLENALFELRMAYIELTQAITRPPAGPPGAK
jgi:hypothetical protein